MNRFIFAIALLVATVAAIGDAHAHARGVGLGVAAGVNIADADVDEIDANTSFAWGFFVDIPLLDTFYITPAATLYELETNEDGETVAITDIDLNFKFIVPIGFLSLGAGVTAGLTTGLGDYQPHYGALAYVGYNIVANLDLFVTAHYKRLTTGDAIPDYNNVHVFGGTMFRF